MNVLLELLEKHKKLINYAFFGGLTTVVNVIVYSCCFDYLLLENSVSTIVAWFFAVLFAFISNKIFVFESREWKGKTVHREAIAFFSCRLGTGLVELIMMYILVDIFHYDGSFMKVITNLVIIVLNYVVSKLVVFKTGSRYK